MHSSKKNLLKADHLLKKPSSSTAQENILFLKEIQKFLREKKIVSAAVEAEILVLHWTRQDRVSFFTGQKAISPFQKKQILKMAQRRTTGLPLAYLIKTAGFWGRDFWVGPSVLIPRPETELLVEETLKILTPKAKILEVGTGSGCIAVSLTIARPDCRMTALDVSAEALKTARKNARLHGVRRRISFFRSHLFSCFGLGRRGYWDVIVSNPPYIPKNELSRLPREVRREPRLALDGGARGFEVIEALVEQAPRYLRPQGTLLMEIGKGQSKILVKKVKQNKTYKSIQLVKDYAGIDRMAILKKDG